MKPYIFFVLISSLFFTMCDSPATNSNPPSSDEMVDLVRVEDTISEKKFKRWRASWEKHGQAYLADTTQRELFEYFTLPIVDLKEVLAENASGTKFYFGLDGKDEKDFMLKFMLVGTDKKGNDLIDDAAQNYIYDFSKLCPPICDGD